jgi:NAD+ synthase
VDELMNRIQDYPALKERIATWLSAYYKKTKMSCFVVGVSGGIDSAVVSTLAAETGKQVYVLNMPIHQKPEQEGLSAAHIEWLEKKYPNVTGMRFDLTGLFESFKDMIGKINETNHSLANTRSRLRMVTLYQIAGRYGGLVVGTGNKVEDYGVGFYTKYGDGGVDIAPIADLYKTEVWELGKFLGVDSRIIEAKPTDGLWDDGRNDEDQLGASYEDLEYAMEHGTGPAVRVLHDFHAQNKHKMQPIPTFKL